MADTAKGTFEFTTAPPPADLPLAERAPRYVTWRSFGIGTLLCALLCAIMPYNDYIVENTIIIGSYLPLFVVLAFFILVVLINAPLHALAPRKALSRGELAVIMAMLLVACAVPAQGLFRTFISNMVAPWHHSQDPRFFRTFTGMDLPGWLWPVSDPADQLLRDIYGRVGEGQPVQFRPWLTPLVGWGVFIAGLFTALISMAMIIGPQWSTNERLAFPIAQLQQALIEPPERGRWLNEMFRSRQFWIAVLLVIFVHLLIGGHKYFPQQIPKFELRYDLSQVFTEEPWVHLNYQIKVQTIFFTFIGITYFIPGRLGFSLWSIFIIVDLVNVVFKMHQAPIEQPAFDDQQFGATLAILLGIIWVGRHQWAMAVRHAIGRVRASDVGNYRWPMIMLVLGLAVMLGWLMVVGVQWWVALLIVAVVMMTHLVVARVVAETGMPCMRLYSSPMQVMGNMPATVFKGPDVFFGGVFYSLGPLTTRESLLTFATHGLRVASENNTARVARSVVGVMAWALVVSFVVSAFSWIWTYNKFALPLTYARSPENHLALVDWPKSQVVDPVNTWADGRFPPKAHDPATHVGIGFGIAGVLQLATLRWAAWPFTPIGFLMASNPYIRQAWFSIFLGWLLKTLIVKYGGAKMFQQARPVFYGMVFGEALAALFWMITNFYLAAAGYEYKTIQLLPI